MSALARVGGCSLSWFVLGLFMSRDVGFSSFDVGFSCFWFWILCCISVVACLFAPKVFDEFHLPELFSSLLFLISIYGVDLYVRLLFSLCLGCLGWQECWYHLHHSPRCRSMLPTLHGRIHNFISPWLPYARFFLQESDFFGLLGNSGRYASYTDIDNGGTTAIKVLKTRS